jgi:HlyD family secretion protein
MNKLWLVGGGVLVAGALLAWSWRNGADPAADSRRGEEDFVVRRGSLPVTLTENGTLVAKDSKPVVPKIRGQGKIVSMVEEGKVVAENEILCKLDPTEAKKQLEEVDNQIVAAESELNTAKTELDIQQSENVATVEKAKVDLDKARKELERYRDGDAPQERRKLEVDITDARTEFVRAQKRFDDSTKLLEQNFIKKIELEDHKIALEKATVKKEGAELALQIFEKYTWPMNILEKEIKSRDGERELTTAQKRADSRLNQKQVAVELSTRKLNNLKRQRDEAQKEIDNMEIKAPCPGIVLYGDPKQPWYRENIKVGGEVWSGSTVMTIPDLRVMQVKLQVHEADINKLKLKLSCKVTMDTYPGLVLEGEVSKIAQIANSNRWEGETDVKRFDVELTLKHDEQTKLKPGVSAKAEIFVEDRKEVLSVPVQCVFLEGGTHYCHARTAAGRPERRALKVGIASETFIEVQEGVAEGDKVLLFNPSLPVDREKAKDKSTEPASFPKDKS